MVTIVEARAGHYEVRESWFARSYVWCPGSIELECECGSRLEFKACDEEAICGCGRDHTRTVRERLAGIENREAPWNGELAVPERSERCYRRELEELN
ncbi:hypothetical protein [Rubrobacter indicoceani]|uniref:hypothetical protein n=1 Tax=Rubrobacter indicoceani TaxID=2051957 RepID=UPI0013C48FEB|nr:hypothetical protein [Rubrobacter indicoceani]